MASQIILVDTSILIEFFRKSNKDNSVLMSLVSKDYTFVISAVTYYEIYTGAILNQLDYWNKFLEHTSVLPIDKSVAEMAVTINQQLKRKRKQIEVADLFIAATAVAHELPFVTLNKKHFVQIEQLNLID